MKQHKILKNKSTQRANPWIFVMIFFTCVLCFAVGVQWSYSRAVADANEYVQDNCAFSQGINYGGKSYDGQGEFNINFTFDEKQTPE